MEKKTTTPKQKERVLQNKILHMQKQLHEVKQKQQLTISALACKHKLDQFDHDILNQSFAKLFKELRHGKQN